MTSRRHLDSCGPSTDYTLACQCPTGRENTINCLEIEKECHVTSRCYARRFLSDDSFADFANDFVKIQIFQTINVYDYGLVYEQVVLARLAASIKT